MDERDKDRELTVEFDKMKLISHLSEVVGQNLTGAQCEQMVGDNF